MSAVTTTNMATANGHAWRIGLPEPRLGLGCNRLGSTLAAGGIRAAEALVEDALDCGIRLFDVADTYAQGDSEKIIGRVVRRSGLADVVVSSKAGFVLPAPGWLLRAAKPVVRALASRPSGLRSAVAEKRAKGYQQDFAPPRLERALDNSLRRLQLGRLDLFLLHSPPPVFAGRDDLLRFGEEQIRSGKIRHFGVSCQGETADLPWLESSVVRVVQVPLGVKRAADNRFLMRCRDRGVSIIARELLKDSNARTANEIADILRGAFGRPEIAAVLIGTTSGAHIRENVLAARLAMRAVAD